MGIEKNPVAVLCTCATPMLMIEIKGPSDDGLATFVVHQSPAENPPQSNA
jgi:hypothetical protein